MSAKFNLKSFFEKVRIGEPHFFSNNIVFIPVENRGQSALDYISLKKAVDKNLAEVNEVSTSGSVPELKVINRSNFYILIPQGEHLVGAKQNRIVNTSILIEPNTEVEIPVSCIEQGRWAYIRHDFIPSEEIAAYKLRKETHKTVSKSLSERGTYHSNQSHIWNFINQEFEKDNLHSPTSSYTDYMKAKLPRSAFESIDIELPINSCGFAFYVGTKLISFEYFSSPQFFNETMPRLVKAILIDAQDYSNLKFSEEFDYKLDFMGKISSLFTLKQIIKKSVAAGTDFRCVNENQNIELSFLVYKDEVVHMLSFF